MGKFQLINYSAGIVSELYYVQYPALAFSLLADFVLKCDKITHFQPPCGNILGITVRTV